jgi:RimJ/RimL family protein N-acetyltransferase
VFAYTSDPRASRYLGWRPHRQLEETRRFLAGCAEGWRDGRRLRWLIRCQEGTVVGMIEAQLSRTLAGVGYVIAPEHWGRGYATEALCLAVDALFCHTSVPSVWAVCDAENHASARVLEKSCFLPAHRLPHYRRCPNLGPEKRDFLSYVRHRQ